ncbi:MAG: alpha/beta fold hydrolase [Acidobacteriota bacterium]
MLRRTLAASGTVLLAAGVSAQAPPRLNVEELGRLPAFSHATQLGDVIFVSGTLGTLPGQLEVVDGGVGAQTRQTLANVRQILVAAGSDLNHVAKCNVYLADMSTFGEMNEVYIEVFGASPPARTTVNSPDLALGASVEIECIAAKADPSPPHLETSMQQATGTLDHDGETIYYEVTGQGPETVVLSHGAGGNHAIWFQQVLELAQSYRVITWDQRAFGRTTNRAGQAGPIKFVEDLGALLDHLGVDRAHLVGQSMGGWTSLGFALAHPERVLSLVLADTPGGVMTEEVREDVAKLGSSPLDVAELAPWEHPAVGPTTSRTDPLRGFLYRQIGSTAPPLDPQIGRRMFAVDHSEEVTGLDLPVLLIVGSEDQLFTPRAIRSVANLIQRSRVVEIPGAGHSPYFERPEVWNRAVLEFLEERK